MLRKLLIGTMLSTALTVGYAAPSFAEEVEVLHWWTSGGEAAALDVLKKNLEAQGVVWKDMPVAGGGGEAAMTALRARVTSGNPPTAVQALGFDITDWAKQGVVGDLGEVAAEENWDAVVPAALQAFSKYDGKWIAAPVNVHSTNWVWINKKALDAAGGKAPESWDELIAVLDKMKANGISPIGHGGQAWQDATIFDAVVLAEGTDFYKASMIDLDPAALSGEQMVAVFDKMGKLKSYVDADFSGRDWNLASAMVIEGKAGMQFMGDWAKGEFLKAGQKPGTDFVCIRFPGTQGVGHLQLRPVHDVPGRRRQQGGAAEDGLGDRGPGVPVGVQRRQGLGACAHRRAERRVRRLRQEGHGRSRRSRQERQAVRLDGPRPCQPGGGEERHV